MEAHNGIWLAIYKPIRRLTITKKYVQTDKNVNY